MKQCSITAGCGKVKQLSSFYKKPGTDGYRAKCKECMNKASVENNRTIKGLLNKAYTMQKRRSKERGHTVPLYTKQELIEFAKTSIVFYMLYDAWVESNYDEYKYPSFDRLDDSKPYSLDNIQIVTWKTNLRNAHKNAYWGRTAKVYVYKGESFVGKEAIIVSTGKSMHKVRSMISNGEILCTTETRKVNNT